MRIPPWLACAALLAGTPVSPVPSSRATPHARQEEPSTPEEKLKAIERRYNKQQEDASTAYDEATTDEERGKALANLPGKEYLSEFRAVAEEARGTPTAVKAWMWVLELETDGKASWEAVELLLSEHMESLALSSLTEHLGHSVRRYGEAHVTEALRVMVAESPHEKVRADALFTLGSVLLASSSAESRTEGRDCLQAVIEEYGTLPRGSGTYGSAAEGTLFEQDHLQIGMTAPDFQATDENGVSWKLSDYRGKVVVVDFWGYW